MKSQRLKKLLRWSVRIVLTLVVLLALFILEENLRGRILLAHYKAELRSKGEKLTLEELGFALPREEGSGNAELGAAGRELTVVSKEGKFGLGLLSHLKWVAPGRVIVRCREPDLGTRWNEPSVSKGGDPLFQNMTGIVWYADWDDLGVRLSVASNVLTLVRCALTNNEFFFPDYREGSNTISLGYQELDSVRTWLAAAGLYEIHDEKLDSAVTDISLLVTLARSRRDERLLRMRYPRIRAGETGLDLTWEALQAPEWNESQLNRLQGAWKVNDTVSNTIFALETERSFDIAFYDKVRESFAEWQKVRRSMLYEAQCGCGSGKEHFFSDAATSIFIALWRLVWIDQAEVALLKKYQSLLEATRAAATGRAWHDVYHPPSGVDSARYFLLNGGFGWAYETVGMAMQFETRRQMTLTAIAIRRFQILHGRLPSDLQELTPGFLTELPRDYMTDRSLQYRCKPDGTFILYSVGNDGRDDGGDATGNGSSEFLGFSPIFWRSRDAVWPVAATQEEIEAFELRGFPKKSQDTRLQR